LPSHRHTAAVSNEMRVYASQPPLTINPAAVEKEKKSSSLVPKPPNMKLYTSFIYAEWK
jgi:hypothetical protein